LKRIPIIIIFLLFGHLIKCQNWLGFGNLIPDYNYVSALYLRPSDNKLYIGGNFYSTIGTKTFNGIMSYDGINFDTVGTGINMNNAPITRPQAIIEYNGELYIGGFIDKMGAVKTTGIAKWDGVKWDSLGPQLNGNVNDLEIFNGELYAAGFFWKAGTLNITSVVKYDGTNWSNPGSLGFPYTTYTGHPFLNCIEVYNNELFVGGDFYDSTTNHICVAKFDGNTWEKVGLIMYGGATEILDMKVYNGNLYVAGRFKEIEGNIGNAIIKYNGSTWSKVGETVTDQGNCEITRMKVINNKLWIVGGFKSIENTLSAGGVAIWNDTNWCVPPTGSQVYKCSSLEYFQNKMYLGGSFDSIGVAAINNLAVLNTTVTMCSSPVGVKENKKEIEGIKVYPNPSNGKLFIEAKNFDLKNITLSLLNQLGQIILTVNATEIDISSFDAGIYCLKVQDKTFQSVFKIIKE
jgi:hypothetical protein